ncbi:MAG: UvrD-helicase domain-containing protein, partial [Methanomicrobiales archaeon]
MRIREAVPVTARVVRWSGGPGAGKTRQLLAYCEREAEQGATVRDLAVMSFSRAQTADLADRLRVVFPGETRRAIRARCTTIHAAALAACRDAGLVGDPRTQVITPDGRGAVHYREFAEAEGLPYDPAVGTDEDDRPRAALPFGNQIVGLDAYLTATLGEPGGWRPAAQALGFSVPAGG